MGETSAPLLDDLGRDALNVFIVQHSGEMGLNHPTGCFMFLHRHIPDNRCVEHFKGDPESSNAIEETNG